MATSPPSPGISARARSALTSDASLVTLGLVLVSGTAWAFSDHFMRLSNLESVAKSSTIIAVMAMGELLVVITGGIDISIGSTFGLAGGIAALALAAGHSPAVAVLAGLAAGLAIGLANGLLAAKLRIAPFIATLGTMGIVRGLNFIIADAQSVYIDHPAFLRLESGSLLGVPVPILLALAGCAATHALLSCSVVGGRIYAVGGEEEAARMLGVDTGGVKLFVYAAAGFAAALGGLMSAAKVEAAYPRAGEGYEFEVIAAVIVGGANIAGGRGSAPAAVLGALFIGVLKNAIIQMDISQFWQQAANGIAIIVVIAISALLAKRR